MNAYHGCWRLYACWDRGGRGRKGALDCMLADGT